MRKSYIRLFFLMISCHVFSQVGINTESPQVTLHVTPKDTGISTAEGVILTNLTREQLIAKDSKYGALQKGAIVYVTDLSGTPAVKTEKITSIGYYYFDGNLWQPFGSSINPWNKVGTLEPATGNTDNIYLQGKAVVGGNSIATNNTNQEAVLSVIGGDAVVNGITLGRGSEEWTNSIVLGINGLSVNTTGSYNLAIGMDALKENTDGYYNLAIGNNALQNNQTGYLNLAVGSWALADNVGSQNLAIGTRTLTYNAGSFNFAIGNNALENNISGEYNMGLGFKALSQNNGGNNNLAIGIGSLQSNQSGNDNTAIGLGSHQFNNGNNNVAVGSAAGTNPINGVTLINNSTIIGSNSIVGGNEAIAVGYNAQALALNSIAIGANSMVDTENTIAIGNSSITTIKANVPITVLSDRRVKKDIQSNVSGLPFIKKLNPVTYHLDIEAQATITGNQNSSNSNKNIENILQSGFIAQEVEQAAKETGYDFNGIYTPKNNKDTYGLNYSSFVVPLVKAVQEQQQIIEKQEKLLEALETRLKALEDK